MQIDGLLFFVIVIAIGYLVLRVRLVPESAADILPKVLLNVCFPAMLFSSFAAMEAKELLSVGIPTVLATLGFSLGVFAVVFFLFRKLDPSRRALLRYISSVGNTSFVCIPLLGLFLNGSEMSIVLIHGAVMDLLIWGLHHQVFIGSGSESRGKKWRKILTSPSLLAVAAGILCAAFSVKLPGFVTYAAEGLAAAVSPLSLLLIGMLICRYGLLTWVKDRTAILYSLWKVLLLPCIVFTVLYFLVPLKTACILAVVFGSPAPLTAVLWCKEYGHDTALAVDCLIPSTILYFAVMGPLLAVLTHCGFIG